MDSERQKAQRGKQPEEDAAGKAGPADGGAADDGGEALNDARALQQMVEGVPDTSDEFRRIERKP